MLKISILLFVSFIIRFLGINWDAGSHLHPDERMLMMVADKIHFYDNLNPEFFNYGSLPIYILKGIGQIIDFFFKTYFAHYGQMLYLGRFLSTLAEIGIIFLIYKITILIFKNEKQALFSSFLYSIAFFTIQNSHFFIVDTFLNFFITFLIYICLLYVKKPSNKYLFISSLIFAAAFTTKFTAIIFTPLIILLIIYKSKKKLFHLFLFTFNFLLFTFLFMPYMFIDNAKFINDISLQLKLNNNPYVFPYTLQYVATTPYIYYIKNIFLWGLGPFISFFVIIGSYLMFKCKKNALLILFISFYIYYFILIGGSAVKFMRYMLPMYPFFAILGGYGIFFLYKKGQKVLLFSLIFLSIIWSLMFIQINSRQHSRIAASSWINANIPSGTIIATEHWDDILPLYNSEKYTFESLTLYDLPDNEAKWININNKLSKSKYLIISSNRLYIPLTKLRNCNKYLSCYPKTAKYYDDLFNGKLEFKKVAEFTSYPFIKLGNFKLEIIDDTADESFTVYDHPKVYIFKKVKPENIFFE